jgi:hypothetical protein
MLFTYEAQLAEAQMSLALIAQAHLTGRKRSQASLFCCALYTP